ncbi:phosphatidylglycerol lysyltransferase domain-containing protein [Actinoplanes sp. NPDC048988]|uniref:phosphatidylglycerol lysyltransferase domain-containing protein n=1 Tax=Actinoplanes sp. NPDC048988 TaxID=3363901 RepID=UPI00371825D0
MKQTRLASPPLSRRTIARLVQVVGLLDVLSTIAPHRRGHHMSLLMEFVPAFGVFSARAATVVVGMLLIYLGAGLRRGKRRAWQVAAGLSALAVALHLLKGLDFYAAGVSGVLFVMLLATQDRFTILADRPNRWRSLQALVGFGAAGFVLGFIEIAVRANRLVGTPGVSQWAEQAALGLIGVHGPIEFRHRFGGDIVAYTTGACGLLAVGVALVVLLRPGSRRPERTDEGEARLRELLQRYGKADSLSYFATRDDKSLMWSENRAAVIAYRVVNGVSLAAGDPIGPESAWPEAIGAWLADAQQHGWTPAVLGCGNAAGKAYKKAGLDVVELGDEAIVDTTAFSLNGRPMRGVRQAVNRMQRAGYTCRVVRQRDLTEAELTGAIHAADAFRDGPVERGFSMALSRLGDPCDGDNLLVLCHDEDGKLRGLLQFVPWGADGLSLDLMRGDRTAENGLTELMVVSVLEESPALGVRRVSLNFAVLRSVFARAEELGAGPVLRLWARLLRAASKLWQIESLYRSNAKYLPSWVPRYLCFPTARDLPRIAVAAMRAEAFLPEPRMPSLRRAPRAKAEVAA